jgi:hypothetical protein
LVRVFWSVNDGAWAGEDAPQHEGHARKGEGARASQPIRYRAHAARACHGAQVDHCAKGAHLAVREHQRVGPRRVVPGELPGYGGGVPAPRATVGERRAAVERVCVGWVWLCAAHPSENPNMNGPSTAMAVASSTGVVEPPIGSSSGAPGAPSNPAEEVHASPSARSSCALSSSNATRCVSVMHLGAG